MTTSFPINAISPAAFTDNESLLTVEDLKARYLFGVDLTDENDNEIPKETLQHFINTAVSFTEHKLDLTIKPRKFEERYDYRQIDYTYHNFLQLKKRPVIEVEDLRARFPNNRDLVKYPEEWYVLEKESAQIQLSPIEGSFNGLIITNGGSYVPLIYGTRDYWPHLFQVTYTAGFCPDQIPVMLTELIGLQAAISIFEILGDLVLGPGVAGESVNLDGAGVSKNLTASAMYSAYSARIESYKKKLEDYTDVAKKYYNAIPMTIV
jgi:hypothetical protein